MNLEKNQVLDKQNELIEYNRSLSYLIKNTTFEVGRRLEHFGFISSLSSLKECVEAMAFLNLKSNLSNEALQELGLSGSQDSTFLGYPIKMWKEDIKTRKVQIETAFKIEANKKAIELLEKHLSPDDIFSRDMVKLNNILNDQKNIFEKTVNVDEEECEE